jgi:hypothetical protein
MAIKGMDVDAGKTAAQQVTQCAQDLEALNGRATQCVEGFEWIGPDAERVRGSWQSDYRTRLAQVTQALQEFAQVINTQAQEQEQTSA